MLLCAGIPVCLAALFGLAAVVGLVVLAEAGGHSPDPTDPANYNSYALRNDSPAPLYLHLCADPNCATLDHHFGWDLVNPGSADDQQVYWGSTTPTAYAVARSPSDAGRRCLLLNAAKKIPVKVDVSLSSAKACG